MPKNTNTDTRNETAPENLATTNETATPFRVNNGVRTLSEGMIAAVMIAALLYGPERAKTFRQTLTRVEITTLSMHLVGLSKAVQGSLLKNAALSQREPISKSVDRITESHESMHPGSDNKSTTRVKMGNLLATAGIISLFDTTLTNYHSNRRIHHTLQKEVDFSGAHRGDNVLNRLRYAAIGSPVRLTKNMVVATAGIASSGQVKSIINTFIEDTLPDNKATGTISAIASSIAAGAPAGIISHGIDTVNKEQVRQANLATFKAPPVTDVVRKMYNSGGLTRFFHGAHYTVSTTTLAFLGLQAAQCVSNWMIKAIEEHQNAQNPTTSPNP